MNEFSKKQLVFKELFVGTLIYVCVLGFLSDYTNIVYAKSFSYLFYASFVLEVLTFLTLLAKKKVLSRLNKKEGAKHKAAVLLGAWLILFLSKFVFIGAIDLLFMGTVTVYGFFNIFAVVLTVTLVHKAADSTFKRLGGQKNDYEEE
jgi:L-asparagine transporter-like permease